MEIPTPDGATVEGVAAACRGARDQLDTEVLLAAAERVDLIKEITANELDETGSPHAIAVQEHLADAATRLEWAGEYLEAARDRIAAYLYRIGAGGVLQLAPEPIAAHVADKRVATLDSYLSEARMDSERPRDAYYAISNKSYELQQQILEGERQLDAATLEELRHLMALEDQLCMALIPQGELSYNQIDRRNMMYDQFAEKLREQGNELDVGELQNTAHNEDPNETWEYFYGQLEQYRRYLEASPGDNEKKAPFRQINEFGDLVNVLSLTNQHGTEDIMDRILREERLQQQASGLANTLLDAYKPEHAVPFGRLLIDEQYAGPFMAKLAITLEAGRRAEDPDEYRRLFNHVYDTLPPRLRDRFVEHTPHPDPVELVRGSRRTLSSDEDGKPIMYEEYKDRDSVWAGTTDGTHVPLPYGQYTYSEIRGYRTPVEKPSRMRQEMVDYATLDDKARAAIETAVAAQEVGLRRPDITPQYHRLTVTQRDGKKVVYTSAHDDAAEHVIDGLPDEDAIRNPVRNMQPVSDGYIVVPHNQIPWRGPGFRDADANFFGPGAEQANAFWVTGTARTIYAEDPRIMTPGEEGYENGDPKYVIVPVRYYKVEEETGTSAA